MKSIFFGTFTLIGALLSFYGHADTIDLNSFPDNTPVSAGNPYDDVVVIGGSSTAKYFVTQSTYVTDTVSAFILGAIGEVTDGAFMAIYNGYLPHAGAEYHSNIDATFLQPVTDISFQMGSFIGGVYQYSAVNAQGIVLTGSGSFPGFTHLGFFMPFSIDLPPGYHFTDVNWNNADANGAIGAAIAVADIEFTLANGVPEQGTTWFLLAIGGLTLYGTKRIGLLKNC